MTLEPDATRRPRASLAANAPVLFLVGIALVGVSLLLLGVLAAEANSTPVAASTGSVRDGVIVKGKLVPPYGPFHAVLEVEYEFPEAPGDAFLVHCADLERLLQGREPLAPLVRHDDRTSGSFSRSMTDYLGLRTTYFRVADGSPVTTWGGAALRADEVCFGAWVAFRYSGTDSRVNEPDARVHVREVPLDSVPGAILIALAATGAVLGLAGALLWPRARRAAAAEAAAAAGGEGTAETLYRLAERSEAWLARTRRYVLVSGPLGVFLWYPVLVPWAWRAGREASATGWMPWALAAGAIALLAGLTVAWAREFVRLDRELRAWREQLAELRRREAELWAELSR